MGHMHLNMEHFRLYFELCMNISIKSSLFCLTLSNDGKWKDSNCFGNVMFFVIIVVGVFVFNNKHTHLSLNSIQSLNLYFELLGF